MPPKRKSDAGVDGSNKKAKQDDVTEAPEWAHMLPVSKRWSKVSGSRNADAQDKYLIEKDGPEKSYSYVCICKPPWVDDNEDEEDEEDGEDEDDGQEENDENDKEGEGAKKAKATHCDGGETCLCDKPAAEHPDHPWIITYAGKSKFLLQQLMLVLRNADGFGMYIYNDWYTWGSMEALENLILDFVDAKEDWKEQWRICESLAWWLNDRSSWVLFHNDDGEKVTAAFRLVGRIFLGMLALLESKQLLSEDSEVKDLGLMMALFIKQANDARRYGEIDKKRKKDSFDNYVLAYANKFAIPLKGPADIDELAAACDGTVKLPVATAAKPDVWKVYAKIKAFGKVYASATSFRQKPIIGGDRFDITTMSIAERKDAHFDHKDPLDKEAIKAVKLGSVITCV